MSKQNVEKALKAELASLNEKIDAKIIRGLSYARESRQHKYVLHQLTSMRTAESRMRLFGPVNFARTFIL